MNEPRNLGHPGILRLPSVDGLLGNKKRYGRAGLAKRRCVISITDVSEMPVYS